MSHVSETLAHYMSLKLTPSGAGDPLASRELAAATTQILASRKRKAWEGIHEVANSKWTGGQRPPALRYQWLAVSIRAEFILKSCSDFYWASVTHRNAMI